MSPAPNPPDPSSAGRHFEDRERTPATGAGAQSLPRYFDALSHVVDDLADGILLIGWDWKFLYANARSRQISRLLPENINRETLWEMYPDMGERLNSAYHEAMELREERVVDAFYYKPFDTWFDIHILPASCGLALHYQDTTTVRAAEAVRDAALMQLQEALDTTSDGVTMVDHEWRITYMNPRALEHVAPTGNPVGKNLWESFPSAVYEGSPYLEHYYRAMDEGIAGEFEAFYPAPIDCWFRISVKPSQSGIIFFALDVTEQKQAQAALIQSEKLAAVGRLASSIAHEINNPLEAVTNLLYLASANVRDAAAQGYLESAEQELRRVSIIANQTLRFHKQATRPQAIGCAELLASVLTVYEGKLKNAHVRVETRERFSRTIVCYEGEIRQVLANLIGNSVDAMPSGGRLLLRSRAGTEWRTGRQGMILTVADTGSGIDSQTRARIFDAFFTTKGMAGTGLGLWVSAEIVTRHQGRLQIRSSQREEHRGTVVTLFLPFELQPSA